MGYVARVDSVEREARLLTDALSAAPDTTRVPTCPEWTLRDLAAHVGEFTALWTHVLCEASNSEKSPYAPLTDSEEMAVWFQPLADCLIDAQSASGTTTPLNVAVAADAIDEIFVMLPVWGNPPDGSGLSLHLHDVEGGEWTITLPPQGPQVVHDHLAADLTLTGSASDLALLLFRRPTIGPVDRSGVRGCSTPGTGSSCSTDARRGSPVHNSLYHR